MRLEAVALLGRDWCGALLTHRRGSGFDKLSRVLLGSPHRRVPSNHVGLPTDPPPPAAVGPPPCSVGVRKHPFVLPMRWMSSFTRHVTFTIGPALATTRSSLPTSQARKC